MKDSQIVRFLNSRGQLLYGMLHLPDPKTARNVCVLLLSPGIKGRIGPHRLYLKIADRFAKIGFHVMRFDFHGLGDSEGELNEGILADMYNSIQGGRYVADTVAAMDWIQEQHGIRRFVGSGLCGGSITALLTAQQDPRIESLLGIGLPVTLDGGEVNWGRFLTRQQIGQAREQFFERLVRPSLWTKFLTGRSNYRVIWRVLVQVFDPKRGPEAKPPEAGQPGTIDDTNPLFAPAFLTLLHDRRPVLLVYSGGDRLQAQFEEKFEARNRSRIDAANPGYQVHTIPQANHIMSDPEWTKELIDVASDWLDQHQSTR